jgi:hypothetical protein
LLGQWERPYEEARIDFALPTEIINPSGLESIADRLDLLSGAASEVAAFSKSEVIGIFAAYQSYLHTSQNQLIGYLCDYAKSRNLSYFFQFPTDGGETIWGIGVYNTKWYPHEAFDYHMVYRRASDKPHDNTRRVHRLWTKLVAAHLSKHTAGNRRQAYFWRQEFSCERLQLIRQTRQLWDEFVHVLEGRGHFARIQFSGGSNLISRSSFDGIIDGRIAKIYLKVISLKLWFAAEVYRRALAHTEKRYPGYDRHHFEDGTRIGERLLVFDSDTHMLAWHHQGLSLCNVIEDENITAFENCMIAPYPNPMYGYKIEEGHHAVTLVIDREPITSELLKEIEQVMVDGKAWPLSDTPKSYDYYKDGLCDLFSEFSYPELVVLNNEEALVPPRDVDDDLFEACRYLDIKKIRLALHRGANPNAISNTSTETPLMLLVEAIRDNHWAILYYKNKFYRGKYPVVHLSAHDKVAMVELLLKYGTHPDVHWFENTIPLAIAAINNEEELVATLLKNGSDPSIQSYFDSGITDWPTAWDYATDYEHHEFNLQGDEEGWQTHERIVAMFESLRPTPYYVQTESPAGQPQEPQLVSVTATDNDAYAEIQLQSSESPLASELTMPEREYIETSQHSALAQNCYYLALAYNSHEPRWILEHCSPEVEYTDIVN